MNKICPKFKSLSKKRCHIDKYGFDWDALNSQIWRNPRPLVAQAPSQVCKTIYYAGVSELDPANNAGGLGEATGIGLAFSDKSNIVQEPKKLKSLTTEELVRFFVAKQ